MPEQAVNFENFKRRKNPEETTYPALKVISDLMSQKEITPLEQNLLQKLIGQAAYSQHVIDEELGKKPEEERNKIINNAKEKFLRYWRKDHPSKPDFQFHED